MEILHSNWVWHNLKVIIQNLISGDIISVEMSTTFSAEYPRVWNGILTVASRVNTEITKKSNLGWF